jgi:type IV secretion system protein VirB1
MAALVRTESEFRPLAIGINGGAKLTRQPVDKAEAVATAKWLLAKGYNIDLGLGQVNSNNLAKTGLTEEDAFDPCKNLAASATILHGNYQAARRKGLSEQDALYAALSAYNTGSFTRGFSNGYVQKVVYNAGAGKAVPVVPATRPANAKKKERAGMQPEREEERRPQDAVADSVMVY